MIDFSIHWLRPYAFILLIPWVVLALLPKKPQQNASNWQALCDPQVLEHLLVQSDIKRKFNFVRLLWFLLLILIVALAGPSWQKQDWVIADPGQVRVILLDLSENMLQNDLTPNRYTRAKHKLYDLLQLKLSGPMALIAVSDEPFVVTPLTEDHEVLRVQLPQLNPAIMPVGGFNLNKALTMASHLVRQAGYHQAEVILLTANTAEKTDLFAARKFADRGLHLNVWQMTAAETVLAPTLRKLASKGAGQYQLFTADDRDVHQMAVEPSQLSVADTTMNHRKISHWQDAGFYLAWLALLLLLPLFTLQRGQMNKR